MTLGLGLTSCYILSKGKLNGKSIERSMAAIDSLIPKIDMESIRTIGNACEILLKWLRRSPSVRRMPFDMSNARGILPLAPNAVLKHVYFQSLSFTFLLRPPPLFLPAPILPTHLEPSPTPPVPPFPLPTSSRHPLSALTSPYPAPSHQDPSSSPLSLPPFPSPSATLPPIAPYTASQPHQGLLFSVPPHA